MKKILLLLVIFFLANLGCKKDHPLCACSPIEPVFFTMVIKNAAGDDLLNPAITGSFNASTIQLYRKDADGSTKMINFLIRPPYGTGSEQVIYYQLFSPELVSLAKNGYQTFYLKLGDGVPYELSLQVSGVPMKVEKLWVNKSELTSTSYPYGNIFYFIR